MRWSLILATSCCLVIQTAAQTNSSQSDDATGQNNTNVCVCGLKHRLDSRIIGGERSDIRKCPWMISITVYGSIICGGALLNEEWILTAAHCFKIPTIREIAKVSLGITQRDVNTNDRQIAEIISHPNYRTNRSGQFDIALIRLTRPVVFSGSIYPICLPNAGDDYTGDWATVAGWGLMKKNGETSKELRSASVMVISLKKCTQLFKSANKTVNENNICAGGQNRHDACQGDSGSPLFVEKNGVYRVIGIVSWGIGCASKYPGVYTNVAYYSSWIAETMQSKCYNRLESV